MTVNALRKIQLTHLAYVYYRHKDAVTARKFIEDFGFFEEKQAGKRTYYRGYGTEPFVVCIEEADEACWGGAAFAVATAEDLEYAAATLPAKCRPTAVYELTDAPGGGRGVTFYDPIDGFPFHLVYGQQRVEARDPMFPVIKVNYPVEKNRPVNRFQRFEKRPAPVHKLGHFGMCVTDFVRCYDFYSTHFNFFPSELVHDSAGVNKTVFFRLDRGEQQVDHHVFFLYEGPKCHVHHTSYETHDFDTQILGHDWLRDKGYRNCWGVGRHVMGSQIFDYWFDPSGFILEHYVDGDLLNMSEPTHHTLEKDAHLHVWGPEVPSTFMD
ncbi:trihydroxytoluene oxygenase [Grosmannia clavigera kw1407]|uniref:Trihydroxytoluene oxygenase n=1 Tax=Grosmannia clavigera (strain kw1407 / UAMH 11150) TaxID=655863 RepID=F0X812_GROCL|nr:trihydroxytoluene oxygenase [Grosmannia clavigera kw1407]EFX06133.1 trihydroxytoluene oxygenase [Grosmannia clavigera kw1407]